jgi:hypothetical protein
LAAALAANDDHHIKFPFDVQLVGVNAACDNATSFILDIGTAADPDAYLDGVTVTGAADTTTSYGRADFVNGEYPHIAKNTEVLISVDYDGGAGNDAAGVAINLFFTEG